MKDVEYQQQLELKLNATKEATPEEVKEWQNGGDFFMTGKFDALKAFVVVPTIIQMVVIGGMMMAFLIIGLGLEK
mgnify:CR=1 FL=1|tara:strand:- start:1209 stop:1433 length:225 start_codon:yes stop_codon:yes gene_type:complete